jgi:fused signal recognition particle receptor
LVIDANVGQNAISQLHDFDEAVGVSGMVVAKLDGSARGGVLFSLAHAQAQASQECTPVYFIGLGESADDLVPFDPDAFVEALLAP